MFSAAEFNFERLVIESSRLGPVMVHLWAPWAGPSLHQGELLRRLTDEYGGYFLFISVSTDQEKALAERFGVKSLSSRDPFRHGRPPAEHIYGMHTESDYPAMIEHHEVALVDKVQIAALARWGVGDHDKAIQMLTEGATAKLECADCRSL